MIDVAEEVYEWLAYQSEPKADLPLTIAMRLAPKVVTPIFLANKLSKGFTQAAVEGKFDQGNKRITTLFQSSPEIERYERSALRTSRVI